MSKFFEATTKIDPLPTVETSGVPRPEPKPVASRVETAEPAPTFSCDTAPVAARAATAQDGRSPSRDLAALHPPRIANVKVAAGSPVLPFDGIDERAAERYRVVRTRLIQLPSHPKVICLSSAGPGDGKSVNAVNLAGALALKSDHAVLLIDSDLRQATLARLLGLPAGPGLSEVLSKQIEWHQAIVRIVEAPNLFILCAGELKLNPAELLDSREWKALCESVRTYFDHVVVDSPPMGVVADYDLIASACDGVIIVARQDHSNLSRLRKCIQTARSNQLIGVLMNYVEPSPFWKNHDDTAYGYGYPTAKK